MFSRPDKNIHNKNTENIHPIDDAFEKVRQWMTVEEIESYGAEEYRFANLLNIIHQRYKHTLALIETLKQNDNADSKRIRNISLIEENIQVNHFLYQQVLDQFNDDFRKCVKVIEEKLKKCDNERTK